MDGVLDKKYAQERLKKKYLKFRYKQRALVSAWAVKKYLDQSNGGFKLVDFGAAEGLALAELARLLGDGGEFTGIEYDQSLIESAPEFPPNIRLEQGDVAHLSYVPDNSVDAITALAVLEHLRDPLSVVVEAKRILRPGGIFIATSPVPFWDKISDKILTKNKFGGGHHMTDMNKKAFLDLGKGADLEVVNFFYFMWAPIGFLPYLKIPVSAKFAWTVDRLIGKLKVCNWLFVNQCMVFRKK